jgi:hypothetical protein
MVCDLSGTSEDGSMVKATVRAGKRDVEAGAASSKHYVPFVELFRGHWLGMLVHTVYEACECLLDAPEGVSVCLKLKKWWAGWLQSPAGDMGVLSEQHVACGVFHRPQCTVICGETTVGVVQSIAGPKQHLMHGCLDTQVKQTAHRPSVTCAASRAFFAGIAAIFYLGYSWLPSFFVKHVGIPQSTSLWMVLSGMVIYTIVVPVSWVLGLCACWLAGWLACMRACICCMCKQDGKKNSGISSGRSGHAERWLQQQLLQLRPAFLFFRTHVAPMLLLLSLWLAGCWLGQ